jgi:hypothetical protein
MDEVKKSVLYKLFPTIIDVNPGITTEELESINRYGVKSRVSLMSDLENIIWLYEDENPNISRKDVKGALDIYELVEIVDNETVLLTIQPKKGTELYKKLPSFFWEVEINLRTGEGEVTFAGD